MPASYKAVKVQSCLQGNAVIVQDDITCIKWDCMPSLDNLIKYILSEKTGFYFHNKEVKFQLTVCKHIRKP